MLLVLLASSLSHATEWTPESKKVVYVSRTQSMSASPEQCLAVASDFRGWKDWTAWSAERDPEAEWTYTDVDGMVGDEMTWSGPELDSGRTVITGFTPAAAGEAGVMAFTTYFGKKETPSLGRITCAPADGGGTLATWDFQMKAGLFTRLFRGAIETAIGGDFEVGLAGLAAVAEGGSPPPLPAPEPPAPTDAPAPEAPPAPEPAGDPESIPADEPVPAPPIADPPTNPAPGQPPGQPL